MKYLRESINVEWLADLAYAYVGLLWVLEILLFLTSLVLHVSVVAFGSVPSQAYGGILFSAAVMVGVPVNAFIKDGLRWKDQIKSCPNWMWTGALTLGVYALFILLMQAIFSRGISPTEQPLTVSAFPLAFDAIYSCVLYSVLRSNYLDRSEIRQRTLGSVLLMASIVLVYLAYRAGYLHHPA